MNMFEGTSRVDCHSLSLALAHTSFLSLSHNHTPAISHSLAWSSRWQIGSSMFEGTSCVNCCCFRTPAVAQVSTMLPHITDKSLSSYTWTTPLSREYGACKTAMARFWLWHSRKGPQNLLSCSCFAWKRLVRSSQPFWSFKKTFLRGTPSFIGHLRGTN